MLKLKKTKVFYSPVQSALMCSNSAIKPIAIETGACPGFYGYHQVLGGAPLVCFSFDVDTRKVYMHTFFYFLLIAVHNIFFPRI